MTTTLSDEAQKLAVLARGALARAEAIEGAAVRDADGRTYAGATVSAATLSLSALQVAVAAALSSGATGFEAAVLVNGRPDDPGLVTLREISADAYAVIPDARGSVVSRLDSF